MPDGHDSIGLGQRIVGKDEHPYVLGARCVVLGQLDHRRGGIGGDDPVAGVDQMPGEQPAAAADLQDEAAPFAYRLEQGQDPRRAGVGVKAEAEVMHEGEVLLVVGRQSILPAFGDWADKLAASGGSVVTVWSLRSIDTGLVATARELDISRESLWDKGFRPISS
jgi:hypothetical protein